MGTTHLMGLLPLDRSWPNLSHHLWWCASGAPLHIPLPRRELGQIPEARSPSLSLWSPALSHRRTPGPRRRRKGEVEGPLPVEEEGTRRFTGKMPMTTEEGQEKECRTAMGRFNGRRPRSKRGGSADHQSRFSDKDRQEKKVETTEGPKPEVTALLLLATDKEGHEGREGCLAT